MKSGEFLFARESHVGYVAPRAGFPAQAFAKIIRNHKMESRFSFGLPAGQPLLQENPVEHLDQLEHANLDSRFFQQFPSHAFFQALAKLQCAARNRPFPAQRLASAADQQRTALIDNHASDANHRPFGVLSGRAHSNGPSARQAMASKAVLPCTGVDFLPRGIEYAARWW